MASQLRIAIVGEFNPSFMPHEKTNFALGQMCSLLALHIDAIWISTRDLFGQPAADLSCFDAIWMAPGSPYRSMQGALTAIRFARESGTPLLATCEGSQHVPAGQTLDVYLEPGSRAAEIYGATCVSEQYDCNFRLDPEYQKQLHEAGLVTVGRDARGEPRILVLEPHPFFLATLFLPQLTSTPVRPHPLIAAFVRSAFTHRLYSEG